MCILYRYYLCVSVILDHFAFVFFKLVLLHLVFSSTKPRDWLGRTSLKWLVLCRAGRQTLLHFQFLSRCGWILNKYPSVNRSCQKNGFLFAVNLKAELNGLRNTVLGILDYPAELVPVINRLSFAQCAYLLSVYRLETLRFVCCAVSVDTVGQQEGIRPVKSWVVGCWHGCLSGARCRLAYGPADAAATHCLLIQ